MKFEELLKKVVENEIQYSSSSNNINGNISGLRTIDNDSQIGDVEIVEVIADETKDYSYTCRIQGTVEEIGNVRLAPTNNRTFKIVPTLGTSALMLKVNGSYFLTNISEGNKIVLLEDNDSIVKYKELDEVVNAITDNYNLLRNTFNNWIPVPGDGGAKLKQDWAAISEEFNNNIEEIKQKSTDMENKNIRL